MTDSPCEEGKDNEYNKHAVAIICDSFIQTRLWDKFHFIGVNRSTTF